MKHFLMFSKVPVAKPEEAVVQPIAAKITPSKTEDSLTKGTGKTVSFPIFGLFDTCYHVIDFL